MCVRAYMCVCIIYELSLCLCVKIQAMRLFANSKNLSRVYYLYTNIDTEEMPQVHKRIKEQIKIPTSDINNGIFVWEYFLNKL